MASIILPPGSAPANPSEGEIYYDNTAKQVKFRDNAGFKGLGGADLQGEPHIITKKLHPAYLGKLLDDTTSHAGAYGTEQSDGRMYYYTDIAGSKPIHDPRIGTHFGSQRHKFRSLQLLEQETATHGSNVHSVDGREWCRFVGEFTENYGAHGHYWYAGGNTDADFTHYVEFTGYFNAVNILSTSISDAMVNISIDGVNTLNFSGGVATANSPLLSRYVDAGSVVPLVFSATPSLGIHTVRIGNDASTQSLRLFGIELIAQDTTSSSTKVQIQVPAQDVVSYGRKFSVSATAQHYDPFNGFSSGDANALATKVDTATSLGLAKWLHSGTYYRPYNGMRVVKWIDENGAIKTSVTCMPPNAKSIGDSSTLTNANAKANASIANNTFYPTFEAHTTSVNEDNLHEVAKTFHHREMGNGGANGNASYRDATVNLSSNDIAFVLDDGLTSLSGDEVTSTSIAFYPGGTDKYWYLTFIGTGISVTGANGTANLAMNLPYGTHILKYTRASTTTSSPWVLDGVEIRQSWGGSSNEGHAREFTIHQPKKPLIPDSACVLADYMVFADFKPVTGTPNYDIISKGVRWQSSSRDVFADETDGDSLSLDFYTSAGYDGFHLQMSGTADSDTSVGARLPFFGTNWVSIGYQHDTRLKLYEGAGLSSTDKDSASTKDNTANEHSYAHLTSDLTLGNYIAGVNAVSNQTFSWYGFQIVTPIHTSHHYQSFETPFLHELIGGDRSMEQTNLICSSDGKSWDEITRDVSYIGNAVIKTDHNNIHGNQVNIFDEWRGGTAGTYGGEHFNKDFAIAYDRMICLKEGNYMITFLMRSNKNDDIAAIRVNGQMQKMHKSTVGLNSQQTTVTVNLKRGDYVEGFGVSGQDGVAQYNVLINFQIIRL